MRFLMIALTDKLKNLPKPNIINLTECKDRRSWTESEFSRHGLDDIKVHLYDRYEEGKSIPFAGDPDLIAQTTKGKGVRFMENKVNWHYKSPSAEELEIAMNEIENA